LRPTRPDSPDADAGGLTPAEWLAAGDRIMTICNSCRYCEGYCAVFPAMERRLTFNTADLNYLANLCHNCGECFYACQYAPPHEFAVNVPQILSEIRVNSYNEYAWPSLFSATSQQRRWLPWILVGIPGIVMLVFDRRLSARGPGDFYAVVPHAAMVAAFGGMSIFILIPHLAGFARFWRKSGESLLDFTSRSALKSALGDIFTLRYLASGGAGCTYPDEHHSHARRWFHHFTFYGFLLCFASTSTAAFYHYALNLRAPYDYFSLPVVLGTLGGIGLLIGPAGLYALKRRQDQAVASTRQNKLDIGFIVLLFLTSVTGLLLLALRESAGMPALLMVHLFIVALLFATLPYGKFVHGIYRAAALVKFALERSRPSLGIET
jgi:citrate/tricarballylate utilization protein